jgi:phosphate transport system substrate-binding protein
MRRRRMAIMAASTITVPLVLALLSGTATASPTPVLQLITGSGSSWAANAVDAWIANVAQQGVQVVFTPDGSAAGRQDYALHTVDFAVSDIGYQGDVDGQDDVSKRPYAYLPVTAGGTAFPYNLVVAGKQITNLRLSGSVIAKIFMNQITNWDNPAITANNNGHALPDLPITTVVPSEGSGTTAMFTEYLNQEFPAMWQAFNSGQSGMTEYWPRQGPNQIAQDGSSEIMSYIQAPASNGSIGIDEYSYPLAAGFPVAQMENAAGYYVLPTEYNDAVALTQAQINMDKSSPNYLLQNLSNVYGYTDPRTYPLSSYSYTIMPVSTTDPRMQVPPGNFPAKWQTLADFLYYSICEGQESIGPIGYSALPVNLVEAGFQQIEKIKAAAPQVNIAQLNITTCNNPTFIKGEPDENHLAKIAPFPPQCDKNGFGPCNGTVNGNANGGKGNNTKNGKGKGSGGGSGNNSGGSGHNSGGSGNSNSGGGGGSGAINPLTGQRTGTGTGNTTTSAGSADPVPSVLSADQSNGLNDIALGALAVILLLAVLIAPPLLARHWSVRAGRR